MSLLKREPALVVGLVISLLLIVQQVLTGDLTWSAAVPLLVTAVTRFFVSPA